VFLIALPLCLGIALASGFPPIAGVFTAIVGGLVAPFISNSELTIKGPAAGLIVIVVGCVADFGGSGFGDGVWSAADQNAYRLTLGVAVAAGIAQVLFGLFRGGILGEFFPTSAVHGLLAAIGIIIMAKQIPVALGVSSKGSPLELIAALPSEFSHANPEIAIIGAVSLLIAFLWPFVPVARLKKIPAPVVVVVVSVALGFFFGLDDAAPHQYMVFGHRYEVSSKFLVNVPSSLFSAVTTPDFAGVLTKTGLYWAALFALIGTLESLLSAKAVELLDPWGRKTNLDRDNTAVGLGNVLAALAGGLPMISEIVRSRANVDNGARTRFANLAHGVFLLVFVATLPRLISMIPLSALAALLVFTGFRLAHPREFAKVSRIGFEQLLVFTGTVVAVLATDLLEGIAIGVGLELVVLVVFGTPLRSIFRPELTVLIDKNVARLTVHDSAVFSNWIGLRKQIYAAKDATEIIIDLSSSRIVDHTVMEKLHVLKREFEKQDVLLTVEGLDQHAPVSEHPRASRRLPSRPP